MRTVGYHMQHPTPEARYSIRHVLGTVLGWPVVELHDLAAITAHQGPVLHHGAEPVPGAHHIPMGGPKDLFATTFTLLTDGDGDHARDAHERQTTEDTVAWRMGVLDRPVVDEMALSMAEDWRKADPSLPPVQRAYRQVVTFDVDNGFKYLGREWWRTVGSAARDAMKGRTDLLRERWQVLSGTRPDPYDVYARMRAITDGHADRVIANLLVADRGRHDHAVGLGVPLMRRRLQDMAEWAEIGLHPSYRTLHSTDRIAAEKQQLEDALGRPVTCARQHFLRRSAGTDRALLALGIKEEHSRGLADAIGFRCGTCTPFRWFDKERGEETGLEIWPFQVMDSAMAYKMRLGPEEAIHRATEVVEKVRAVRGTFVGVWHERFLSDHGQEKGWGQVAPAIIKNARP